MPSAACGGGKRIVASLLVAASLVPPEGGSAASMEALGKARVLKPPIASATSGGEFEAVDFWDTNEALLAQAWKEYGRADASVYELDERFLHPPLRDALAGVRRGERSEASLLEQGLIVETEAKGVYALRVFTDEFIQRLLAELDYLSNSGIPMRRPNGMNRYGCILSDLGFGRLLDSLRRRVVVPLAQFLFHDRVGLQDAVDGYGFTVRYRKGEDLELAEHADASVVTLNLCLGVAFEGGELYFKGVRSFRGPSKEDTPMVSITHKPGVGLLHLGQHVHSASPLLDGDRINLVLWCFGEHEVVRVVPHDEPDRTTLEQRWGPESKQKAGEL